MSPEERESPALGAEEVLVVSGLPRSGTSLVMQMLQAGGMRLFVDGARAPDHHNPRGYFEHRAVRQLPECPDALRAAGGSAVKVVAPLLWALPEALPLRVVLLERHLDEVWASQQRMLGLEEGDRESDPLGRALDAAWRAARDAVTTRGAPLLLLRHAELLAAPQRAAQRLADFVGGGLDVPAMARAVDRSLHRVHRVEPAQRSSA